jgi:hypothetical protein
MKLSTTLGTCSQQGIRCANAMAHDLVRVFDGAARLYTTKQALLRRRFG